MPPQNKMDNLVKYVLALRYLYYCKNISFVEDSIYDALEKHARTLEGGEVLNSVSSDLEESYSDEIKQKATLMLNDSK